MVSSEKKNEREREKRKSETKYQSDFFGEHQMKSVVRFVHFMFHSDTIYIIKGAPKANANVKYTCKICCVWHQTHTHIVFVCTVCVCFVSVGLEHCPNYTRARTEPKASKSNRIVKKAKRTHSSVYLSLFCRYSLRIRLILFILFTKRATHRRPSTINVVQNRILHGHSLTYHGFYGARIGYGFDALFGCFWFRFVIMNAYVL